MERGSSSRPVRTVAPVVVSPDIDSNIASVTVNDRLSSKYSGAAPNVPSTVQNEATTRKPSRSRSSLRSRRTGSQQTMPATRVSAKPSMKDSHAWSAYQMLTRIGGSIVMLNTIRSRPRMRCTTVQFIPCQGP
jgi:hypothetical protein